MALSEKSVELACEILAAVNPAISTNIVLFNPDDEFRTDAILGQSLKADGGYESIVLNVRGLGQGQMELFNRSKNLIPNSSICRDLGNGITRIGWF